MVQRAKVPVKSKECSYRKAVVEELTAFEKRENEFLAQERRERAIKLGMSFLAKRIRAAPRPSSLSRDQRHV